MILRGIEAPNILHTNALAENISDIQEKDRYKIELANPPFGGKERKEVQQNFPIKTDETSFLFFQHFIKILKAGGWRYNYFYILVYGFNLSIKVIITRNNVNSSYS